MRQHSTGEQCANNAPYAAMVLLGSAMILHALGYSGWGWAGAIAYFAYGVIGALWIILFLCPYCEYHGSRGCPCGYGELSAMLGTKRKEGCFSEKFRRHIPVIVPLWIIPLLGGGAAMIAEFSWVKTAFLIAFVLDAFVILPIAAKTHGCSDCPQRHDCPWMDGAHSGGKSEGERNGRDSA